MSTFFDLPTLGAKPKFSGRFVSPQYWKTEKVAVRRKSNKLSELVEDFSVNALSFRAFIGESRSLITND